MEGEKLLDLLEDYLADADKIVIEKKKTEEPTPAPEKEDDDTAFKDALNKILG
jgi:hypothetical protein